MSKEIRELYKTLPKVSKPFPDRKDLDWYWNRCLSSSTITAYLIKSHDELDSLWYHYNNCNCPYRYVPGFKAGIYVVILYGKTYKIMKSEEFIQQERAFLASYYKALTAKHLCKNISGACIAYVQSDEISILLNSFKSWNTQPLFDNNIQKIVSVSAGMASAYFSSISDKIFGKIKLATFDSRVFVTSLDEVCNVFEWRQQDAIRNSVQMLARSYYSEKDCYKKNTTELKRMLLTNKGIDWDKLPTDQKRGRCIIKSSKEVLSLNKKTNEQVVINKTFWKVDSDIPIFSKDRNYIDQYLKVNEE